MRRSVIASGLFAAVLAATPVASRPDWAWVPAARWRHRSAVSASHPVLTGGVTTTYTALDPITGGYTRLCGGA